MSFVWLVDGGWWVDGARRTKPSKLGHSLSRVAFRPADAGSADVGTGPSADASTNAHARSHWQRSRRMAHARSSLVHAELSLL